MHVKEQKEKIEGKKIKENKNRFKVNKLLLHVFSNSFHIFPLLYQD